MPLFWEARIKEGGAVIDEEDVRRNVDQFAHIISSDRLALLGNISIMRTILGIGLCAPTCKIGIVSGILLFEYFPRLIRPSRIWDLPGLACTTKSQIVMEVGRLQNTGLRPHAVVADKPT